MYHIIFKLTYGTRKIDTNTINGKKIVKTIGKIREYFNYKKLEVIWKQNQKMSLY